MGTTEKTARFRVLARVSRCLLGAGLPQLIVLLLATPTSHAAIEAVRVATGFYVPLYVCAPPGDTSRIFVAEQHGKIKIINLPSGTVNETPYLDISDRFDQEAQGTGILGMTFDPNYAVNGHFYVAYTTDGGGLFGFGVSNLSRFTVTADPNVADPASEVIVISADQPQHDHNFDWIGFSNRVGDEGNIYICSGDGGGSQDNDANHIEPGGNAQSTETLLGKVLRIHIEDDGTYTIPLDNPFFGMPPPVRQEIFTYGLRNPFRASFDSATGNFFLGDVGEHVREEVDVNLSSNPGGGENYGWRLREGFIQNPFYRNDPPPPNAVDPIIDYDHDSTGRCAIGGYIYHGSAVPDLDGLYVFADCFGPNGGESMFLPTCSRL